MTTDGPLPPVEVLRPAPWKRLALLGVSVMLIWGASAVAARHPALAWGVGSVFALCALVSLVALVPGGNQLRLDAAGLEVRTLFRCQRWAWRDLRRFGTTRVGVHTVVGLDFADHVHRGARMRRINRGLTGYHGALPDSYGMRADALARHLERWRVRHTPAVPGT